ncbi:MAG: aminoacetone oxidase family FAD-binding enzyme, partial [Caulobacterales bacterium]
QFGVNVIPPRPGLVPLTFSANDLAWMKTLAGVSANVTAACNGASFREAALFTHRGLSGPAVLQISSYCAPGDTITIDWAPDQLEDFLAAAKRTRPKQHLKTAVAAILSDRLANTLAAAFSDTPLGDQKDQTLVETARKMKSYALTPTGTEGYAKAEVTLGGVDTAALSQQSMETRAAPGLFFIGEAVDVTGWLGGYNFQWAWASAHAAATALAQGPDGP